jgi:hypothetical protein
LVLTNPLTVTVDPILANDLTDIDELQVTKSRTDRAELHLMNERMEQLDPAVT